MARKVVLTPKARMDLREGFQWYRQRNPEVADRFLEQVVKLLRETAKTPLQYPVRFGRFRRLVMQQFPYMIFYDYDEVAIYVYYIFHSSQSPARLKHRLR
jgi:plasmid stabilization system protein ParE